MEILIELVKRVEPLFGIDGKAKRRLRRKINRNNHQ
jgi:hypothetical protein